MQIVNLWELITTVAGRDLPNSDKCQAIKELCGVVPGFGTELTLTVNDDGSWEIRVFPHDDENYGGNEISLLIYVSGALVIKRKRVRDGVWEERQLSF